MITLDLKGIPVGQGAIRHSVNGHGYHQNSKQLKPWRDTVTAAVAEAWGGAAPWVGPVEVVADFYFPHLKSHYDSRGQLKPSAPVFKVTAPDLDHLERAVGDCLQAAGAIVNDSQVCSWAVTKGYSQQPGLHLVIRKL